jgi:hypothetical protein
MVMLAVEINEVSWVVRMGDFCEVRTIENSGQKVEENRMKQPKIRYSVADSTVGALEWCHC